MSQEQQPQRPVTFGDVLPVSGTLASQPITKEDASLMQRTEALSFGHTQKGGAAASMQSAADQNVESGAVPSDAPTSVTNEGVTYGDVLSVAGILHETPPVTKEDAALMQRAETRTLGHTQKGGIAASMQSAADKNAQTRAAPGDATHLATNGVTYGDIFPVEGALATQPITKEDAALMQRAETLALGHTQKGGAAATMQSAANHNVQTGAVPNDAHSSIAKEAGIAVVTTVLPKEDVHTQFVVAGQPIPSSGLPTGLVPAVAKGSKDTVSIGEALEAAAMRGGDEPIDASDARAIQSAEKRATRGIPTKPGSLAATAQAAAVLNPRVEDYAKTTLGDVLMDASSRLARDKTVTWEDAEKVAEAELRNSPTGEIRTDGVAAALVAAAEMNEKERERLAQPLPSQMEQMKLQ